MLCTLSHRCQRRFVKKQGRPRAKESSTYQQGQKVVSCLAFALSSCCRGSARRAAAVTLLLQSISTARSDPSESCESPGPEKVQGKRGRVREKSLLIPANPKYYTSLGVTAQTTTSSSSRSVDRFTGLLLILRAERHTTASSLPLSV